MTENQEAQALARWLEEHPGQAPPPDVDPEVIEALYALRPDLAPPPAVRMEDIFAAVESGPFRTSDSSGDEEEVTEEVVSLAAERAKRTAIDTVAPASQPPVRRRVPWWAIPGAGALAAAALALVVILPTAGILLTQKHADLEAEAPAQDAAAEAAPALTTPSSPPAEAAAPAPQPAAIEPGPTRTSEPDLLRQEKISPEKKNDDRTLGEDGAVGGLAAPADAAKPITVAPSAGERDQEGAPARTEAVDDLDESLEKAQAPAPAPKRKAEEAESAKEMEAYGAGASVSGARSDYRAKDLKAAAEPPASMADAAATPTNVPAAYGDISSASTDAALTAATNDSDDRKAMTAAWFLADRQYRRGDHDAAMATIAKGLRRAGNDDLRAHLTALHWTVAQSMSPAILDAAPATDR